MATVTNLAFNIISRYNGRGVRAARRDLRQFQMETAIMSQNAERIFRIIAMVGPAAAPMVAVAAKAIGQLTASFVAAGAAAGIFAAAVSAQTKDVFHAVKRLKTLRDAIKELEPGSDAYLKNLDKQQRLMASLDPLEQKMVKNIFRLEKAWGRFGKSIRGQIFRIININIQTLIILMKRLEPVLKPVANAVESMSRHMQRFVAGKGFKTFTKWLKAEGPRAMLTWHVALRNVGMGIVALAQRLGMLELSGFNEWLVKSTAAFRKWAETSESVDKLRAFIEESSPVVKEFLKAFIHMSGALLVALAPAGLAMLRIFTPILELIADIADEFPGLIQAIWAAYAASRALNLALFIMRAAMIGVMASMAKLVVLFGIFVKFGKAIRWLAIAFNSILLVSVMKMGVALSKLAGRLFGLQTRIPKLGVFIGRLAYAVGSLAGAFIRVAPHLRLTALAARLLLNPFTALIVAGVAFQVAFFKVGSALKGTSKEWTNLIPGLASGAGMITLLIMYWDKFTAAMREVGSWFVWLWREVMVPAWHGIVAAGQFAWGVIKAIWHGIVVAAQVAWTMMQPVFQTIKFIVMEVLPRAFTYWYNQVKIVVILIAAALRIQWNVMKFIFNIIKWTIVNVVAPAFRWLYDKVIKPVWSGIVSFIRWVWGGIKVIWTAIAAFLTGVLAPKIRWFHNSVVRPVWDQIGRFIGWVWRTLVKPAFDALVRFVTGSLPRAFRSGVNAVKTAWDKLKNIARSPVNFVIGLYNDGIVSLMNKIGDFAFGKGKGPRLGKINKFAGGGVMPGYSPGRDSLLAAVSPGESIFRPEFTKAVGGRFVAMANRVARTSGPSGVKNWLAEGGFRDTKGYAKGGVVGGGFAGHFDLGGIVSGVISGLKDFSILDPVKAVMNAAKRIIGRALPGGGMFRDVVAGLPPKMLDMLTGWIKKNAGFGGGPGMRKALAWAKTQDNKPYQWAGNGNPSWDCSGFMSAIESVIRGQRPHRRWSTHAFNGGAPPGWRRNARSGFMIGVRHGGPGGGHTAGTLLGHAVEAGGNGVQVGPPARSHRGFPHQFGFKADTGTLALKPGWNPPVYNGLGTTEVLEARNVSAGGITIEKFEPHFHGPVGSKMELRNWLVESLEELKRLNRLP